MVENAPDRCHICSVCSLLIDDQNEFVCCANCNCHMHVACRGFADTIDNNADMNRILRQDFILVLCNKCATSRRHLNQALSFKFAALSKKVEELSNSLDTVPELVSTRKPAELLRRESSTGECFAAFENGDEFAASVELPALLSRLSTLVEILRTNVGSNKRRESNASADSAAVQTDIVDAPFVIKPELQAPETCLRNFRTRYNSVSHAFLEGSLVSADEPLAQFRNWFDDASKSQLGFEETNAVCLSTVSRDGKPSSRMVLLKAFSEDGFKFFTNYNSRKGQDLESNPNAALLIYWPSLHRQVRIEGVVEKLSETESEEYWRMRPPGSQASAFISAQSSTVQSREELQQAMDECIERFESLNQPIPKPKHWGGYLLRPHLMEFWQGQSNRLHDRIQFRRNASLHAEERKSVSENPAIYEGAPGWIYERLAP